MTKQQFLDAVSAKVGFHSIISDEFAPDNIANDPIQKRRLYINHLNATGTMGKTYVYYLFDEQADIAWFYNVEPEAVDNVELTSQQKKFQAIENYLKANFAFYFLVRVGDAGNTVWVEADVYTNGATLTKSTIIASKVGAGAVTHKAIA